MTFRCRILIPAVTMAVFTGLTVAPSTSRADEKKAGVKPAEEVNTKCAVPMVVIAFLSDPKVVRRILDHLKLPSMPPPVAVSWLTAAGELLSDVPVYDGVDPEWRETETDIEV